MVQYGADSFLRSNTSNGTWGVATDSETWARPFGSATTYSVTSNEGVINSTPSTWDHFVLGTNTISTTMDVVVRIIPDNTASNFGVLLRVSSNGQTSYKVMYQGNSGTKGLYLYYDSPGTGLVQIGSLSAFTVTVGTAVWIRGQINGSTLMGKIWTTSEPGSWTLSSSVGANTIASGGFGVVGAANSNLKFDSFTATDGTTTTNSAQTTTDTNVASETLAVARSTTLTKTNPVGETLAIVRSTTLTETNPIIESAQSLTISTQAVTETTVTTEALQMAARASVIDPVIRTETLLIASITAYSEKSVVAETITAVIAPAQSSTDPNSQMLYDDLQIQYQRIRGSTTNAHIAVLALVYYPPAQVLSEHAVPGELDVQLAATGAWSQLRTINDVTAFLAANP